jgi:glycosyltransferase involved in cell wall biosynthesis
MKPLVSIVIPTFNREKYIEECILSALNQSYENSEVIVIDNNSTDSSHKIINRLRESFTFQYIRNEENIGPVNNWVAGIEKAKGYYVKILFSDDVLLPNAVFDLVEAMNNSKLKVGFVYGTILTGTTIEKAYRNYGRKRRIFDQKKYLSLLMSNSVPVSPGAVLIKKADIYESLTNQSGFITNNEYKKHGAGIDIYSLFYALRNGKVAIQIPEEIVFFRSHSESFTIRNDHNKVGRAYSEIIGKLVEMNLSANKAIILLCVHWIKFRLKKKEALSLTEFLAVFDKQISFTLKTWSLIAACTILLKNGVLRLLRVQS